MDKIDFVELATFCTNRAKETGPRRTGKYYRTHYVSIFEDNTIQYSMTPHILRNAYKCILMHEMSEYIYYWYEFEFINPEGCVFASDLENGFNLISDQRKQDAPYIKLRYKENWLYSNLSIQKVWELYTRLKDISTTKEMNLIADLFHKDEKIIELEKEIEDFKFENHLLEQERNQYKELLDEIKEMVEK